MRKIIVFNLVTIDGFFAGPNGEIDWFNIDSTDFSKFSEEQMRTFDTLIFGVTTYKLMADYWPTPEAAKTDPGIAQLMRETPKIVFSKTLIGVQDTPNWKNVTVLPDIKPEDVLSWKKQEGKDIAILGSGVIVQQFANLGLIDEYRLLVNPVILGAGKPLFKDVKKMKLKLLDSRIFRNGNVLLRYTSEK